jgi:hypothetical protein
MAESIAHDVVKDAQSVGGHQQPSDDLATTPNDLSAGNGQATTNSLQQSTPHNVDGRSSDAQDGGEGGLVGGAVVAHVSGAEASTTGDDAGGVGNGAASMSLSESVAQALADASGGSDTDKDGKGHLRTGSVKKPASFKTVSVTKNFLAKSLSASPAPRAESKGER